MFGFGKKKEAVMSPETSSEKKGFFKRLASGLSKTRARFSEGVARLVLGKKRLDDELLEELDTLLIAADVGIDTTQFFLKELTRRLGRNELDDENLIFDTLKKIMTEMLSQSESPLDTDSASPYVIMMTGVNGAGKTTTIGKIAHYLQAHNKTVMLAAGDTFRAAAVEQLQIWGERNNVPVIAQQSGADSAAVCFDALQSAKARHMNVLITDTAGRLHTQHHLMDELKKIKRVMSKVDADAPHEIMLILDASIGQNALQQAKLFHEAVGVNSLCITKLDGTAKGGIIFSIVQQLKLPIRFIGVGEQLEDLQPFYANEFVEALFSG